MQDNSLPGYVILEKLGHGSQGQVFLAQRESDEQPVAIKQLNIHSVKSWKAYDLFHREADILAKLNIDGVAKFYEAFDRLEDDPPCSYIVQEYILGRSIADMLRSGHHFNLNQVYDILKQMLGILEKLHAQNVIHRDIKPSNILLVPLEGGRMKVYLIDFGAVANPQVQGGGSTMAGTFGYMPPEQLMGKPEPASDIYALAAVAVAMITGKSPADMPVKDFHIIFEPDMQSMPVEVVNTLRQMLDPDPTKRLCDYDTLCQAFDSFQGNIYQDVCVYKEHIPTKVQDELLRNVSSYGEPGNIDLWQALDDVLPRNKDNLPACYLNLEDRTSLHYSDGNPIFEKTSFMVDEYNQHTLLKFILKYLISFGLLIISVILYFKISGDLLKQFIIDGANLMQLSDLVLLGGSTIVGLILFVVSFWVLYGSDNWLSFLNYHKHKQPLPMNKLGCDADKKIIENLLLNGRKNIATICSIDYVECLNQFVEHHTIKDSPDDHDSKSIVRYAYHAAPLFKISYQFNPPDDEKSEDLIHYIYTSVAPEGHYQVGDPFPILYRIYRNEDNRESVDSMPFPIPLDDISGDRRVVYYRTREELAEDARKQEEERKRQQEEMQKFLQQQKAKEREEERQRKAAAREVKRQAYQNIKAREAAKNKSYSQYNGKTVNARAHQKGRKF